MNLVTENLSLCGSIAKRLSSIRFSHTFTERRFLRLECEPEIHARALYFAVSICHQTHSLYSDSPRLYGWDYMEHIFAGIASTNPGFLNPARISAASHRILEQELSELFINNSSERKCTLDRLPERAELLRNSAELISGSYHNQVLALLQSTNNYVSGNSGLYKRLEPATAFSDPFRKKSSFLLKLLTDANLYFYKDPECIEPIVDYHMQRVFLRSGTVEVSSAELYKNLVKKKPLVSDAVIRQATQRAMKQIAREAGLDLLTLNDIFWPLGRSCCLDNPLCVSGICSKTPCTLSVTLELTEHNHCLLSGICKGETDPVYRKLWHPEVATHYY